METKHALHNEGGCLFAWQDEAAPLKVELTTISSIIQGNILSHIRNHKNETPLENATENPFEMSKSTGQVTIL